MENVCLEPTLSLQLPAIQSPDFQSILYCRWHDRVFRSIRMVAHYRSCIYALHRKRQVADM